MRALKTGSGGGVSPVRIAEVICVLVQVAGVGVSLSHLRCPGTDTDRPGNRADKDLPVADLPGPG
jgi:hypothetical protein